LAIYDFEATLCLAYANFSRCQITGMGNI